MAALQKAGHLISVAVPATSRSWISKAHLIEASLTATYVPPSAFNPDGTWDANIPNNDDTDWVVIQNGTPASCTQLGLYNLFPTRPSVDLVISGPNHGRNASTIYNLSSGTVGGALEAATCGKRGIAVSFGSKDEQDPGIIAAASRLSVRVVEYLFREWDERVEIYNLNVPMRGDVEGRPVRYTRALGNVWSKGSLYAEVGGGCRAMANGVDGGKACNGVAGKSNGVRHFESRQLKERTFAWSAELSDIKKSLQTAPEGTDAHAVLSGCTRYGCQPYLTLLAETQAN